MKKAYFQRWVFGQMQDVQTSIEVLDGYNKTKFSRKNSKDEQLLLEAAKYAYDNQLVYFVTIFENAKPYCYLETNKGFYRVDFLDDLLRKYMSYDFRDDFSAGGSNKLFLSHVMFWDFEGNTDKVLKITSHVFKPNGAFHITERDLITNEQIDSEAKNKIDVSQNLEEYPEFGDYESIIRKERESIKS
jgi:hypothetical protein